MPIIPGKKTLPIERVPIEAPTGVAAQALVARATLRVDGAAQPSVDALMLEWLVEERINTPARCELLVQNWGPVGRSVGLLFDDRRVFDFGKAIELRSAGGVTLFSGILCSLGDEFPQAGAPRLRLVAVDRLQRLADTRRSRSFADASDADTMRRVAADHGLQADVDLGGPTRRLIAQLDSSDLDFLRRRALLTDARFRTEGTRLIVRPYQSVDAPPTSFMFGGELQSFVVNADLRGQPTGLGVSVWDVAAKSGVTASASLAAAMLDVPNAGSGASIGQSAIGNSPLAIGSTSAGSGSEAADLARALLAAQARRFVTGSGRLGNLAETLHAGSVINLTRLGALHSGAYHVTLLRRRYNPTQGQFTEFEVQRNAVGRP